MRRTGFEKYWVALFVLLASLAPPLFGQGLKPPGEGKAVVYFVRTSSLAFAVNFSFFHERRYIGEFGGRNYLRYECSSGTHLFWASAENRDFLNAELRAGGIYVVLVDVDLGDSMAQVVLKPVAANSRDFERIKKLVDRKRPIVVRAEELKTKNVDFAKFMEENVSAGSKRAPEELRRLSADMAIPDRCLLK